MKNNLILCVFLYLIIGSGDVFAFYVYYGEAGPPAPNEVHIGQTGLEMPLGRFLLVRNSKEYCAIKFNKFWQGKTEDELFATYESYCCSGKAGDFSANNISVRKGELYEPKPIPTFFGHPLTLGAKRKISCGAMTLSWIGKGCVYFSEHNKAEKKDNLIIEFAPTPWSDISQVNVFDPRIKWYGYDEKRQRVNIPIDIIWETTAKK